MESDLFFPITVILSSFGLPQELVPTSLMSFITLHNFVIICVHIGWPSHSPSSHRAWHPQ